MKQKSIKNAIIYSIIAVLVFGILFGVTFYRKETEQEKTTARIVMMGDSILGDWRDETSVSAILSELLGEEVFNGALGGTGMGRLDSEMRLANIWDCLSMHAFSRSIVSDDFGVQQTVRSREAGTGYFDQVIDELERVDFESVEILFIEHALNDYHEGVPIYNEEDTYDAYTFTGALRSSVEILQEQYPDMRIILITPTYSWYIYHEPQETCEEFHSGSGVLEDYVNAELQLAESLGVEVIDLYHDFYSHEEWSDWETYTRDGVHPNENGRRMIAERIYEYLENNENLLE